MINVNTLYELQVETVRTATEPAKARKELFPEGAVGVLLSKGKKKCIITNKDKKKFLNKINLIMCDFKYKKELLKEESA